MLKRIIKWESAFHMNGYYMLGVITIPYLGFGCIITIVSKEERTNLMSIANNPQCTCLDFA